MGAKKPRIVIVGAGMAGITAANRLCVASEGRFEVVVVEGGTRIGGRIHTCEFGGDRVEMGATWIHGVGGSPVYEIATRVQALSSEQPWECMDGMDEVSRTVTEDGSEVDPVVSESVSALFNSLMDFAQGKAKAKAKAVGDGARSGSGHQEVEEEEGLREVAAEALDVCKGESGGMRNLSIGCFLRKGLEIYWEKNGCGKNGRRKLDEEAVFAMHENTQRTYTSADDLSTLDFSAESEYVMCSGREITIAKGYSSIIESLASVLPPGTIRLGWEVVKIDWRPGEDVSENGHADSLPVTLHFRDGATILADHVVVTVSLGVLKARGGRDSGIFAPPLPSFKTDSISRLGFGVVNKLFLQLPANDDRNEEFPVLQLAFHRTDSGFKNEEVPWWMRRTASLAPIHRSSDVVLSWFAGKEALHLETLADEEIIEGISCTVDSMLPSPSGSVSRNWKLNPNKLPNGSTGGSVKFEKVLRSKWGSDPLFLGSYSYVAVGSSVDDVDALAEPLPRATETCRVRHPLQILFAGEATHRTHYSTTHGAYFSGIREANRLLQHYYSKCV